MNHRKQIRFAALAVFFFAAGCRTPSPAKPAATPPAPSVRTYTNPVGGDITMGDPFATFFDGVYYLYGTNYREGFHYYTSRNLVDWSGGDVAYRNEDGICLNNYWAPEVHRYKGKFYLIYSCGVDVTPPGEIVAPGKKRKTEFRLVLTVGDSPAGPFRNLKLPWFADQGSNIDAHLFVDGDRPYVFFDKVGFTDGVIWGKLYGVELDASLEHRLGEPVFLTEAEQPWEKAKPNNRTNEGSFVFKHGGKYYLTYSANHYQDPLYGVGYATAALPLGPWTKHPGNPILAPNFGIGVAGPGHSSLVFSPDGKERFIVYHAHGDPSHPGAKRNVNIDRLTIDAQGALHIAGPTRTPQPFPSGAQ